tara:strand:+ start:124 stop:756 length:633 start_codon:yes stop_codon:yes gene_type:complete
MIITCPNCKSNYKIEETLISDNGRKVKCFNCTNFWIQFPNGKSLQLKSENDFSSELTRRQNLIRNSLNKKNIHINKTEDKNNLLNKEQEKEFLSSLAITEIEQNRTNAYNPSNDQSNSLNRLELKRDKLNSKEKNALNNKRGINKSYMGFILVSILFITCFIFYQKREFIIINNPRFEEQLSIIINAFDILVNNLNFFIEKKIGDLKDLL